MNRLNTIEFSGKQNINFQIDYIPSIIYGIDIALIIIIIIYQIVPKLYQIFLMKIHYKIKSNKHKGLNYYCLICKKYFL